MKHSTCVKCLILKCLVSPLLLPETEVLCQEFNLADALDDDDKPGQYVQSKTECIHVHRRRTAMCCDK